MLSESEILKQKEEGLVVIEPFDRKALKCTSYDLKLGEYYFTERKPADYDKNKLKANYMSLLNIYDESSNQRWDGPHQAKMKKDIPELYGFPGIHPEDRVILLRPNEFILAHSIEFAGAKKPYTTEIRTRSSWARNGIFTVKCAGVGDPDFINRWTMEIKNESQYHTIPLVIGRRIAQLRFYKCDGEDMQSYSEDGKYQNNTTDVDELKKSWNPYMLLPKMYNDRETMAVGDITKLEPPRVSYTTPSIQQATQAPSVSVQTPVESSPVVQPTPQSFQQRQFVAQPQSTAQLNTAQRSASMSIQQMQQAQLQQQVRQQQQAQYSAQAQSVQSFQQQQIQSQIQGQIKPVAQLIQPINMRQQPSQQVQIHNQPKKVKDKGESMIVDPFAGSSSHTPLDKPTIDPSVIDEDNTPAYSDPKMITVPEDENTIVPSVSSATFDEILNKKMSELENPDGIITMGLDRPQQQARIRQVEPQYIQPQSQPAPIPSYVYQEPPPQPPQSRTKVPAMPTPQPKKKVAVRRTTRT